MDSNERLQEYERDSMNKVVNIDVDSVEELEAEFNAFMDQQFKNRRNADDVSISLTGLTNQQRYEIKKKELLSESVNITADKLNNAKKWCIDSNIKMMLPCDNLDGAFELFMDQHKDLRRMADWKSLELFGVTNTQMYEYLKNNEKIDINSMDSYSLGKELIKLDNFEPNSFTESAEKRKLQKKILNKIQENSRIKYKWEFMYSPFFCPKEIFELEGFYSDEVTDEANQIFKEYVNYYNGYNNDFDILEWDKQVRELKLKITNECDINKANMYKQSLIKIGWNPEIEYNSINQFNAKIRLESMINNDYKNINILNLESIFNDFNESEIITEARKQKLKPIHVVLVRGDSLFSDAIVKVTKGPFSHAAICLDNDFERLYSFNASHESNKKGGMSLESIKNYPKDNNIAIFSFFVTDEKWDKINKTVQNMLNNIKNTSYGYLNILMLPFKNINLNLSDSMICSQFVDKLLKLGNIDITEKDSSKVTPNYLYNMSIKNSKVYKVYEGTIKDFDYKKATKFIEKMSKKAHPFNENATIVYEVAIAQYLYPVVSEARNFPLEIKDNGDLLISNPVINFDAEYFSSHKLLMQYDKAKDYESMKYELARLYYMNYILEKRIYSNKYKNQKNQYIKSRARILNDFNKYLNIVLNNEPSFNFAQYYDDSKFSSNTVKIKGSTIKNIKKILLT